MRKNCIYTNPKMKKIGKNYNQSLGKGQKYILRTKYKSVGNTHFDRDFRVGCKFKSIRKVSPINNCRL